MSLALAVATSILIVPGCGDDDVTGPGSCGSPPPTDVEFPDAMRSLVQDLSTRARTLSPGFVVIAQNGLPLLTTDRLADGPIHTAYLAALSGVGQENLFYGLAGDDVPTDDARRETMIGFLDRYG